MKKIIFGTLILVILNNSAYAQYEKDFGCKFLMEIFNYIKIEHKERKKAYKKIGGKIQYSIIKKKIKYLNTSTLSDSSFKAIIEKFDLINYYDHPLVNDNYKTNIILDTMNFFSSNCACLKNNSDSNGYEISNKWVISKYKYTDPSKHKYSDTQYIRLTTVVIIKEMLVIGLNSNLSPYEFGCFYFDLGKNMNPKLKRIEWAELTYSID